MKISSKGRYAVRVLTCLAQKENEYVSLSAIAEKENITIKYLEQIIALLLKENLVVSLRGSYGGYKLSREPQAISIADVLAVTGDMPKLAPCQKSDSGCTKVASCSAVGCWDKLAKIIYDYLQNVTLQDLIDKTY